MWGLLALTNLCMPVVGKPQNPQYVNFYHSLVRWKILIELYNHAFRNKTLGITLVGYAWLKFESNCCSIPKREDFPLKGL
jgi:hypothetical protein